MRRKDTLSELATDLAQARKKLLDRAKLLEIDADITREAAQEVATQAPEDRDAIAWLEEAIDSQMETTEELAESLVALIETCADMESIRRQLEHESGSSSTDTTPRNGIGQILKDG
jgi:hypothetical protein